MAHNVLDYGAIGNSSYVSGGGNDDTAEIQAAITAAHTAAGYGLVMVPGNRTYKLSATIVVPVGIQLVGIGSRNFTSLPIPPTFVWDGAAGGTMLEIVSPGNNIFVVALDNLCLRGRNDNVNLPGCGIKYSSSGGGTAAKMDSGTYLNEVFIQSIDGHGVHCNNSGATNWYVNGGRFDSVQDYGYYFDLNGAGHDLLFMLANQTWDTNNGGAGFIFADGESATSSGSCVIQCDNLHTEVNAALQETYASGTNPYDKRGVIRLGVSSAISHTQHLINIDNLTISYGSGLASHSFFQITGGASVDAASRGAMITATNIRGANSGTDNTNALSQVRLIGGAIPDTERIPDDCRAAFFGEFAWGRGQTFSAEQIKRLTIGNDVRIRGLVHQPTTVANLPTGRNGAEAYVTNLLAPTIGSTNAGGGAVHGRMTYINGAWKVSAL